MTDPGMKIVIEHLMKVIDQNGWAITGTTNEHDEPYFYTAGLTFFRVPELHTSDPRLIGAAETVLNKLASRQAEAGPFTPGQITQVSGCTVRLDPLDDLEPLNWVRFFFGNNEPVPPTALTVVLVDPAASGE